MMVEFGDIGRGAGIIGMGLAFLVFLWESLWLGIRELTAREPGVALVLLLLASAALLIGGDQGNLWEAWDD